SSGSDVWDGFWLCALRRKDSRPAPPFCDIGGSDDETSGRDIRSWWARAFGRCDPDPHFDRELHRRTGLPPALPERWAEVTGNGTPPQRGPLFRDRGRPRDCGIGAPPDARVGVRARGSRHAGHPRLRGLHRVPAANSGEALSLAAILTLGIVGVIFVYLLAASRAFRRPAGVA